MPLPHALLALAVVFVWGTNFVVIKWGLAAFPPFLLATLRFGLSALPLVFLIPRPPVAWRKLAAFGVLLGVGQFGLLFYAMRSDISPGLASLVIQSQVFFTIGMAVMLSGERIRSLQWLALALAICGMAIIAMHLDASTNAAGLVIVLVAALSWSTANIVARSIGPVGGPAAAVGFMVWSSLFAAPPLLAISLALEGPAAIGHALQNAGASAWGSVAWQVIGNSLFGYGAWNWLLSRHPAATVTPSALLVPVFGMSASAWAMGEALPPWKLMAAALVIGGLALNVLATTRRALQST